MPSELDIEIKAILARLTAPGGMFETGTIARFGGNLPVITTAPASLPAYFERFCGQGDGGHGAAEFLVEGGARYSFAQVYAAALDVARALVARHGVGIGARVGLAARNSAAWVVAFMGITMAGGCAVLLNGWWTGEELAAGIALADCSLVLADAERAGRIARRCPQTRLEVFGHEAPELAFAGLGRARADTPLPLPAPEDLATMLFTSGSTGSPKGAVTDHRGVVQATTSYLVQSLVGLELRVRRGLAVPAQQSTLSVVPLFHVTGLVVVLLQCFAMGRKLVMMPRWDAKEAMRLIEAERISYFTGVPLMSHEIAIHPERGRYDLSSCAYMAAGGAPRPVAHVDVLRGGLPEAMPVLGYGLTETGGVGASILGDNYLAKPDSTGPASPPLVEIAILGAGDARVAAGESGEIAIRSVANMRGYWRNEAATKAAFTNDGFFRTGDLGRLDGDGYLFITGRAKDIIIRGGENIASAEVEAAIYAHGDIAEVAVFAAPDARFGEVPVAVLALREGAACDEAGLRAFLAGRLAAYKIPERFVVLPALPRLGTEKIDKQALKARYAAPEASA